jgi:phage FluMu gp28-like protein
MAKSAIPLHSYQEEWFRDRSPNKVACWPRQSGKTLTTSAEIADDSFEKIIKGQRSVWYLVSRSYDQSILALDYCKRFFNAYQITLDYHEYSLPETPQDIIREIRLPHGGRIRAMPAKPESLRGPTGNVYLDEFDIRANDIEFWGAVMPITSVPGCRKIITSTPGGHGPNGLFHDFLTAPDLAKVWSRRWFDIHQCVAAGLDRDPEQLRIEIRDRTLWEREYLCKFVVGNDIWFPSELVSPCIDIGAGDPSLYQGGPCFIGIDIGWGNDLWAAWVIERMPNGLLMTREVSVLPPDPKVNERFKLQHDEIRRLVAYYDVRKISIDATGIGKKPVEDAIRDFGEWRVEGVDMTNTAQFKLATLSRQAFEMGIVRVPGDRDTQRDLQKIRRTVTATGKPSFRAQRDKEGHADRSWAMMLALSSAEMPVLILPEFSYLHEPSIPVQIPVRTSSFNDDDDYPLELEPLQAKKFMFDFG